MSVSYTRTREQLGQMVLRKLGVLADTSVVSADADIIYEAIDLRLKEIDRLGVYWPNVPAREVTFTIPANTISASAASVGDMAFPIALHVTDNSSDDPVRIVDYREYADIENKTDTGTPTKAMWTGNVSAEFIVWPVPTSNMTARLLYEQIADDTTAGAAVDLKVSMLRWLKDMIAYDVADDFGVPEEKIKRWFTESQIAERNIRKLAVQHVDYAPVKVEHYTDRLARKQTDYGW